MRGKLPPSPLALPHALAVLRGFTVFASVAGFALSLAAQEEITAAAPPAGRFQVFETRKIDLGDRSLHLNRVAPPDLPATPAIPAAPSPEAVAAAKAAEALQVAGKKHETLFLSATIFDRRVTQIRWWGETGERRVFSNIDFNFLRGVGEVDAPEAVYNLLLRIGDEPFDEANLLARATRTEDWIRRFGKAVPPPEAFSQVRSEYFVVEAKAHPAPSADEIHALDALHIYFDAHKERLVEAYVRREAENAARTRSLEQHPPIPNDIVVNYWRKPSAVPKTQPAK